MLSEELRARVVGTGSAISPIANEPIVDWNLAGAVDALKRRMILESVRSEGSKTKAAERLGIPRQSLQKMMKRLEIGDAEVGGD